MSSNARRAKNYIKECDLPVKKKSQGEDVAAVASIQESGSVNHKPKDRYKSDSDKPTASELEEAQLLIGAAGSLGEEQVVYLVNDNDVNKVSNTEEVEDTSNEPTQPEISEEDLRKELQALLDSQLEPEDTSDTAAKHLMGRREQVFEDDDAGAEAPEPSKSFTASEIQAFMNNQIRKQHQQHILEEQLEKTESSRAPKQPQQHLILVTQNGDKIILIQNSGDMDNDGSEMGSNEYVHSFDIDPNEERMILENHRRRQQMLLLHLEKLRERHRQTLPTSVTTAAVPHMQPIKLIPMSKPKLEPVTNHGVPMEVIQVTPLEAVDTSSRQTLLRNKTPKSIRKRNVGPPRWLRPISNHMQVVLKFIKRREERIEEVRKMFPSRSNSFESKCQTLKQDLVNIELTLERFQNTIGRDLEEVSVKFRSFLKDLDLENMIDDIEAGDEIDEFDSNLVDVEDLESKNKVKKPLRKSVVNTQLTGDMQIITPSNISITPANHPSETASSNSDTNQEPGPYDFPQEEPTMDIKPVIATTPKTGLVSTKELQARPVRSARLQNKRLAKEVSETPPRAKRASRR